jgi:hypothetical protein
MTPRFLFMRTLALHVFLASFLLHLVSVINFEITPPRGGGGLLPLSQASLRKLPPSLQSARIDDVGHALLPLLGRDKHGCAAGADGVGCRLGLALGKLRVSHNGRRRVVVLLSLLNVTRGLLGIVVMLLLLLPRWMLGIRRRRRHTVRGRSR